MIRTLPRKTPPATPPGNWPVVQKPPVVKTATKAEMHRYLQRSLNSMGFKGKNGKVLTVDGQPGDQTMFAVASLQAAAGITSEKGVVGFWTWRVIDECQYDQWTPCAPTVTSIGARGPAIYKGHNRYSGLPVNRMGILRENQMHSDAALTASPYWKPAYVAVDRYISGGSTPSRHRDGGARDWMADLNKNGNYREPSEISKCKANAEYLASSMREGPMQTVIVALRGDGAKGIADNSVPLTKVTRRFSGRLRVCKVIYFGEIHEWRFVNGKWTLGWWKLKPSSDQHWNHVHSEVAEIVAGILYAGVA